MGALLGIARRIDGLSYVFGVIAIWFTLLAALLSAANAFFRYGLNSFITFAGTGDSTFKEVIALYSKHSNAFLEAQWYMFAAMVLFGAAWTLKVNEHVRVDLIISNVSERTRTWIDLLGGIFFLMPMCILMIYVTWPWFMEAYLTGETSQNAGGLPRWPVKLILPVGFALILLQGIAEIIKCVAALTTDYVREFAYEKPLQ